MLPNPEACWVFDAPKPVWDGAKLKPLLLCEPEPNPPAPKPDEDEDDEDVAPNPDAVEPNPCVDVGELGLLSSEITLIRVELLMVRSSWTLLLHWFTSC